MLVVSMLATFTMKNSPACRFSRPLLTSTIKHVSRYCVGFAHCHLMRYRAKLRKEGRGIPPQWPLKTGENDAKPMDLGYTYVYPIFRQTQLPEKSAPMMPSLFSHPSISVSQLWTDKDWRCEKNHETSAANAAVKDCRRCQLRQTRGRGEKPMFERQQR